MCAQLTRDLFAIAKFLFSFVAESTMAVRFKYIWHGKDRGLVSRKVEISGTGKMKTYNALNPGYAADSVREHKSHK